MEKKGLCKPISAFILLSIGGLLLHLRIHPPTEELFYWAPVVVGVLNIILVPILLGSARTVSWGYVLTVLTIIVGTVTMAYYSVEHWSEDLAVTVPNVILQTTLADILILWAKLPIALWILRLHRPKTEAETE